MTPEQLSRLRTYDPDFDNPDPTPGPLPDHGRLERRLAVLFAILAALSMTGAVMWGVRYLP